jgi:ribosomal protein L11 methyltransferase
LDIVLANIVSSVHLELLPVIPNAITTDARVVLSGILIEERVMMLDRLDALGWKLDDEDTEDIWWSATVSRR